MPTVSVITPVYNGEKYLDEAIQSVLNQTYKDWELLLIDDGSSDGSVNIAREYAQRYPTKISYLEQPGHMNRGQFSARILGAEHARANVIAMLDQDDVWDMAYLEEHLRIWNEVQPHNVFLSYGPSLYWFDDDPMGSKDFVQRIPSAEQGVYAPGVLLGSFLSSHYAYTPNPSSAFIRREVLCSVRKFEKLAKGSAFEDQYLWWYTAARWPVSVHNNVWVRYRQHSESAMVTLNSSAKQTCLAELRFLRAIRDDLKTVCPELSLLTDGRLGKYILDLSKRYDQEVLRERLPSGVYDKMNGLYCTTRATLKQLFKGSR